jgi:hypothetical protein
MVCTRCGAVQRRETARFCHECGATIELAPTNVHANDTEIPTETATTEAAPQHAPSLRPVSLTAPEPQENTLPEGHSPPESQMPQQPAIDYPKWHDEAPTLLRDQAPAQANDHNNQSPASFPQPALAAFPGQETVVPPLGTRQEPFSYAAPDQGFAPESQQMPLASSAGEARHAPAVWPEEPSKWTSPPQEVFPQTKEAQASIFPPSPNIQGTLNKGAPDGRAVAPIPRQTPSAEPPSRSTARGPVPGAFQRPRPIRRRRLPIGVIVTLGLIAVFVVAGIGLYVLANGPVSQEPDAFTAFTDPGHHFSIPYPTVWTVKQVPSGVRFADATDTAELWVTYHPNTSNLKAADFADQEAAKAGISAPAPDSQTFAGTTWVQRSGIVTQTSGISQDIFIFVTVSNNLLYEVREVAPLDGYKDANPIFMRMLQKLILM